MSCDRTMRKVARVNIQVGVPVPTGHSAYLAGRIMASEEQAERKPQTLGIELLRAASTRWATATECNGSSTRDCWIALFLRP